MALADTLGSPEYKNLVDRASLTVEARRHYSETQSDAAVRTNNYRLWHHYYRPLNGDQWPNERAKRPGMVHMNHNVIRPGVDVESRIESRLPKVTLRPNLPSDQRDRSKAEAAERIHLRWLEDSGWETWMADAAKTKSITGVVVLKPLWLTDEKRPDVSVIEEPGNLRIGWTSSDYTGMDWALYEYSISPYEAMKRFPGVDVRATKGDRPLSIHLTGSDHVDPLNQLPSLAGPTDTGPMLRPDGRQITDYEGKQVRIWDYWYKRQGEDGTEHITQAYFLEGILVDGPTDHDYYPDLPFLVIEHDHDPNYPWGMSDVQDLISIQLNLNLAMSHWAQLNVDEIDPAWQINANSAPSGTVPKAGEIVATGDEGAHITPIEKPANIQPLRDWISELYEAYHFDSGLSDILFGKAAGAQTAGRALQIQIESIANRIDPRRDRFYAGLRKLLLFWAAMAENINPSFEVDNGDGTTQKVGIKEMIAGYRRWKIVGPEVTPRDSGELITAVVNKLNAKLISLEDAMDELGVDSPLEMMQKIEAERTNPKLFPGETQAYVAVLQLLQQVMAQQQGQPQVPGAGPGVPGGDQAMAAAQAAQPQGLQGDNGSNVPQPATAAGGPPPPGAPGPGGLGNQTLIRPNAAGGAQALQQIKIAAPK